MIFTTINFFKYLKPISAFTFSTYLTYIYFALAMHGLGLGIIMGLYTLVIIELMGLKNYPATFGSACFFKSIISITIGPLAGKFYLLVCIWVQKIKS